MPLLFPAKMYILLYEKMPIYLCPKMYEQSYLLHLPSGKPTFALYEERMVLKPTSDIEMITIRITSASQSNPYFACVMVVSAVIVASTGLRTVLFIPI